MEIGSNGVRMVLYSRCSLLLSIGMHGRIDNWGKGMGWLGALHGWCGRAQKKLHVKEYVVLSVGEVICLV